MKILFIFTNNITKSLIQETVVCNIAILNNFEVNYLSKNFIDLMVNYVKNKYYRLKFFLYDYIIFPTLSRLYNDIINLFQNRFKIGVNLKTNLDHHIWLLKGYFSINLLLPFRFTRKILLITA